MSEEMQQEMELPPGIRLSTEARKQRERDLWWLDRAIEFKVDEMSDRPVFINKYWDSWFVVWATMILGDSGFQEGYHAFSDRESALAAYLAWKQQQREG